MLAVPIRNREPLDLDAPHRPALGPAMRRDPDRVRGRCSRPPRGAVWKGITARSVEVLRVSAELLFTGVFGAVLTEFPTDGGVTAFANVYEP
jgi:hypothetical protein